MSFQQLNNPTQHSHLCAHVIFPLPVCTWTMCFTAVHTVKVYLSITCCGEPYQLCHVLNQTRDSALTCRAQAYQLCHVLMSNYTLWCCNTVSISCCGQSYQHCHVLMSNAPCGSVMLTQLSAVCRQERARMLSRHRLCHALQQLPHRLQVCWL